MIRKRFWSRAAELYLYNVVIVAASLVIIFTSEILLSGYRVRSSVIDAILAVSPETASWHLLTMQQSIGFSNVLRLYVALMLMAPVYVWLARKAFWLPIAVAAPIWVISGHFGLINSDSLTGTPLTITILPWNLLFAIGVTIGAAMANNIKAPHSPGLILLATIYALGCTAVVCLGVRFSPELAEWALTRNEHFWTGASKSLQSPLRVANVIAVTYLFVTLPRLPLIRLFHEARQSDLLCRLGARSLDVFSFGAVFVIVVDAAVTFLDAGLDLALALRAIVEIMLVGLAVFLMAKIADRGQPLLPVQQRFSSADKRRSSGGRSPEMLDDADGELPNVATS